MTEFDPIKAIKEEIAALEHVHKSLRQREGKAQSDLGQAEAELNSLKVVTGFVSIELNRKRAVLAQLEEKKQ